MDAVLAAGDGIDHAVAGQRPQAVIFLSLKRRRTRRLRRPQKPFSYTREICSILPDEALAPAPPPSLSSVHARAVASAMEAQEGGERCSTR
mgnify:CR=1 FL=1